MGGILDAVSVPYFLGNRKRNAGKDRESTRWPALVAAWYEQRGSMPTSAGQIHEIIFGNPNARPPIRENPDLQVAFAEILGEGTVLSQKQKLGRAPSKHEDRVWGEFRIGIVTGPTTGTDGIINTL